MTIAWENEDVSAGLCGLRWNETITEARKRFKLEPSSGGYQRVVGGTKLGPGIPVEITALFNDKNRALEEIMLTGYPCFPEDGDIDTWEKVVGPALNEWLKTLGFSYEKSQRWQSDENDGGNIGSLGEGDYEYFRTNTGTKAQITVLWDAPEWSVTIRPPSAPDFEQDEDW